MVQGRADGPAAPPHTSSSARNSATATPAAERPRSEPTGFDGPDPRGLFWRAQRMAWKITQNKRQAWCRRVIRGDAVTVTKRPRANGKDRAGFEGLFHCGRNGCPLCGPKIAAERAADIALAITAHYAAGGRVASATWTMRHNGAQRLGDLLEGLGKAYRAVRDNKVPKRLLKRHSIGQIRKLETTHSPANGWHPHHHELVFLKPGTTDEEAAELDRARFAAWSSSLERQGFGTADLVGHTFRVLDLDQAHELVAGYVAKSVGHELAAAGTKRGRGESRTPLELLIDLDRDGLDADRRLWLEYEQAMHGKRVLRWSPGLREQLLGDELSELSDQEAADSTDGGARIIAAIGEDTWRRVCRGTHEPSVILDWAEAYEDDDQAREHIGEQLRAHELGELHELGTGHAAAVTWDRKADEAVDAWIEHRRELEAGNP
jgi:hypothetical protein